MLVGRSLELAERLKERLAKVEHCKVLNAGTTGPSVNWWVLPKGRNAQEIFERLERDELTAEQRQRYFKEIRHLFDKRLKTCHSYTSDAADEKRGVEIGWHRKIINKNQEHR